MITKVTECPICFREYETNPKTCACGFSELRYVDFFSNASEERRAGQWFDIYKYAKKVYYGQIPMPRDQFLHEAFEDHVLITDAPYGCGVSVVDVDAVDALRDAYTVADAGILAFRTRVSALILNVDEIGTDLLDEACPRMLFLGPRVQKLQNESLKHQTLRYLFVDPQNPCFTASDHVLFDKSMTVLYCYPTYKPEEEYTVPESVKRIAPRAFGYGAKYLRRVRMSHKFRDHQSIREWFGPQIEVEFY